MRYLACLLFSLFCVPLAGAEENFLMIDGTSKAVLLEIGPHLEERVTPCSTFKIPLSLIGFDAGILVDTDHPTWHFKEGYDTFIASWKEPQTPRSWLKTSCIWFSQEITQALGMQSLQEYLERLDYGNCDLSGGLTQAWLTSSLKISPQEQVIFLQKMLAGELPITQHAVGMTRTLLFIEELPAGWKLYGKTGWSGSNQRPDGVNQVGWLIGWIERQDQYCPFAYQIRDVSIALEKRLQRTKELALSVLMETPPTASKL